MSFARFTCLSIAALLAIDLSAFQRATRTTSISVEQGAVYQAFFDSTKWGWPVVGLSRLTVPLKSPRKPDTSCVNWAIPKLFNSAAKAREIPVQFTEGTRFHLVDSRVQSEFLP